MLVLSRKKGEALIIGDDVEITILEIMHDAIKIGIKAPREIGVLRKELYVSVENMNIDSNQSKLSTNDLIKQYNELKKNK